MYVLRTTRGYFDIHTCSVSSACISDIAQGRESVLETARARDSRQPNNGSVLDRNVRIVKVYTDSNAVSPQRTQEIIRTQTKSPLSDPDLNLHLQELHIRVFDHRP
jgi:hypothetical protein